MGETTALLEKRIRHWKTTLVGVAGIIGPVALHVWPEHSQQIIAAMMALNGVGFMAAADAKPKVSTEPPTK